MELFKKLKKKKNIVNALVCTLTKPDYETKKGEILLFLQQKKA